MAGERERIAKSALLAIAELTEVQHRKCYVILFSDDIECIEITDLGSSFDRLVDFLCQSFHGGTDIEPVITHALRKISEEGYSEADIITVSDLRCVLSINYYRGPSNTQKQNRQRCTLFL